MRGQVAGWVLAVAMVLVGLPFATNFRGFADRRDAAVMAWWTRRLGYRPSRWLVPHPRWFGWAMIVVAGLLAMGLIFGSPPAS